jgi:hypothetical protein
VCIALRSASSFPRLGFPLKVFSNLREAMPWLLKTVGPAFKEGIRHDQLSALVDEVRKTHFSKTVPPPMK